MSKSYKAGRAAQARRRRKRKIKHLAGLQQQSSATGATSSLQTEYDVALKRHNKLLKTNRERISTWTKKLAIDVEKKVPNALAKATRLKEATKASYLKRKKEGSLRSQKAQQRSERKMK